MTFDFTTDAATYESLVGKGHKYYMRVKCDELLQALGRLQPRRILDVGCGTGQAEELIGHRLPGVYCLDFSGDMLAYFKAKGLANCRLVQGDALHLPFPDATFDIAFSVALFHHLGKQNWSRAVGEMRRVVKKEGLVVSFEHNPANPFTRIYVSRCPVDPGAELVSLPQMEALFRGQGIQVIDKKHMCFLPYPLTFLYPVEQMLHRLPFGAQYMLIGTVP